jgi:hypothetical protein
MYQKVLCRRLAVASQNLGWLSVESSDNPEPQRGGVWNYVHAILVLRQLYIFNAKDNLIVAGVKRICLFSKLTNHRIYIQTIYYCC